LSVKGKKVEVGEDEEEKRMRRDGREDIITKTRV